MSIKKIVASAGIAAGAFAALAGTAQAAPQLPQIDPIEQLNTVTRAVSVNALKHSGGNVGTVQDGAGTING
ncbi:hypothetical protein SAMN05216188_101127 [Lentzea xinjiangensis]|uniref:Uncharacterized protein n=1 Tax=Lentzea xinjiangensis TaxID=402600 RepID=A0A1H8ZT21_9PSEU|nr:hypothetical protein [Lentzea xinjiangensis]SEP66898.1 hypothetical protein SAMN05216188_101127 [Lentzea xinjiangensis]